jgi:glycosyltransferase involved in cell wall biosynthesis
MPLVSVIVPAFRAEATLARALRSLQQQSLADWEALVVADDGQDYLALLAAAGLRDPRFRFLDSGGRASGPAAARNAALPGAGGAFLTPLDADDLYHPRRLERLVPLARQAGAAFDNVSVVDDASGRLLQILFEAEQDFALDGGCLLETSVPLLPLWRRELDLAWDPAIELCDDVAFNLRLLDRLGPVPTTAEPLHEYRVREGSVCHSPQSAERAERGYRALLARLETDRYGLADAALAAAAGVAIGRKRALNQAFAQALAEGRAASFQEFVAERADRHEAAAFPIRNS